MTPATAELLRCPLCGEPFEKAATAMRCGRGHHFDVARQGYVNLLTGRTPGGADTQDMVAARAAFLAAGHFDFLTGALAQAAHTVVDCAPEPPALVVDVGAGPGHHLAAVLDRLPGHHGLALDVAAPAVRRAVRAHERIDGAVCDAWRGLPLADACADVVLDVFAPRNGGEFHRVLRPTGALLVVTPRPDHLAELVDSLGLLVVDPAKERRLEAALGPWFTLESEAAYRRGLTLTHEDASRLVAMGPSGWHTEPVHLAGRLAELPTPLTATASVILRTYRPVPP
jgi:23S rRNA (guanine745-N1)-methyltransferase